MEWKTQVIVTSTTAGRSLRLAKTAKKLEMKLTRLLTHSITLVAAAWQLDAATIEVTEDIAAGAEVKWTADNTYLLKRVIYVQPGATLTIEPGTVVKGVSASEALATAGIPNAVSALWVTRGGKLMAQGTADKPIIFTAQADDVADIKDLPVEASGLWGGVVLLGNAQVNSAQDSAGNVATPKYEVFEGTEDLPQHRFGGADDGDSSGVMRYVSIRYPGNQFAPDRELNGLTMGGVGSGTVIEHVEVYGSSDDGFEWWGGRVNTRYLASIFSEDDSFDTDQGYRGVNQFWLAVQKPGNGDKGGEHDGDLNQANVGTTPNPEQPRSMWYAYNATFIGNGISTALNIRDESAANYVNGVFTGFAGGVLVDNDARYEFQVSNEGNLLNNVFDVGTFSQGNTNARFLLDDTERGNVQAAAGLMSLSATNDGGLDPRPAAGSPALVNVRMPHDAAVMAVNYRGAFGPNDLWARGWTALDSLGILTRAPIEGVVPVRVNAMLVNGRIEIGFPTEVGRTYEVQYSTDLTTWVPTSAGAAQGTGSPAVFSDETSGDGLKFYRVIQR